MLRKFAKTLPLSRYYATMKFEDALRDPNIVLIGREGDPTNENITFKNDVTGETYTFENVNVSKIWDTKSKAQPSRTGHGCTQTLRETQADQNYRLIEHYRNENGLYTVCYMNASGLKQTYYDISIDSIL
jgi:hypothetical protein